MYLMNGILNEFVECLCRFYGSISLKFVPQFSIKFYATEKKKTATTTTTTTKKCKYILIGWDSMKWQCCPVDGLKMMHDQDTMNGFVCFFFLLFSTTKKFLLGNSRQLDLFSHVKCAYSQKAFTQTIFHSTCSRFFIQFYSIGKMTRAHNFRQRSVCISGKIRKIVDSTSLSLNVVCCTKSHWNFYEEEEKKHNHRKLSSLINGNTAAFGTHKWKKKNPESENSNNNNSNKKHKKHGSDNGVFVRTKMYIELSANLLMAKDSISVGT